MQMAAPGSAEPKWWLLQAGATTGPFTRGDLSQMLAAGRINQDMQACSVGTTVWRPLTYWFPRETSGASPGSGNQGYGADARPDARQTAASRDHTVLPTMAIWICIYGMYVSPVLWLLGNATCLIGSPAFVADSPFSSFELIHQILDFIVGLATTIILFLGAVFLWQLRRIGTTLVLIGLWTGIAWFVLSLVIWVVLYAGAASEPGVQHLTETDNSLDMLLGFACFPLCTAAIFQIAAAIWLTAKSSELPLRR